MAISTTTAEQIRDAMARFDREAQQTPALRNWEKNNSYKFAIRENGNLYPMKTIIGWATGQEIGEFSGGPQSIAYIKKLGFTIEALHLPTESEVKLALHDLLLLRYPQPISPQDAYALLGDQFELSKTQRTLEMEHSTEAHWENRVRQARRKLVDARIIDNAEHGVWTLIVRTQPKVWIEKCHVAGRPDREGGPNALGKALWSPTRSADGADGYRNMRRVAIGDYIIHLIDNKQIVGISQAADVARANFIGIDGSDWEGRQCYRIALRDYQALTPHIDRAEFFDSAEPREELKQILDKHSGLFYSSNLALNQGAYLTEAPEDLVRLFDKIYQSKTGQSLPLHLSKMELRPSKLNLSRLGSCVRLFRWIYGDDGFGSERYRQEERDNEVERSAAWRKLVTRERIQSILNGNEPALNFVGQLGSLLSDQGNLLPWRYARVFKEPWEQDAALGFVRALDALLFGDDQSPLNIDKFNEALSDRYQKALQPTVIKPASHCIPSLMLWLNNPDQNFFLRAELYNRAATVLLGGVPEGQGNVMTTAYYAEAQKFGRSLADNLTTLGLAPSDMIDVQGFMWTIFRHNRVWFGGKSYGGNKDMLPKFIDGSVYAIGFGDRPEVARLIRSSADLGKTERETKRNELGSLGERAAEKSALLAFYDLLGNPGSLLLAKSVYFHKKSLIRISGVALTTNVYDYDETLGHKLTVEWRSQPKFDVELSGSMYPKLTGTLIPLQLADALDVLSMPATLETEDLQHETLVEPEPEDTIEPTSLFTRQPKYTLDDFVRETRFAREDIDRWHSRLARKKHVILQGPPGTGKTYVAERLVRILVSDTVGYTDLVQFHPTFAYEDFIQGIRPSAEGGHVRYDLQPGRFKQFCDEARKRPEDVPCALIIDEINRANLSRVFGELMYLLEYRDRAVPLSSGGEAFSIPANVYIVGTMNTADRSIALVDHALRRRFAFIRLSPDYNALHSYMDEYGLPGDGLITALKAVNAAIDDPNYHIGISYFLADGPNLRRTLEEIWRGEIEPHLEEYFYGKEEKAASFRWDALITSQLSAWKQ